MTHRNGTSLDEAKETVKAVLAFLLVMLAMGLCGGIERGTIPFPM